MTGSALIAQTWCTACQQYLPADGSGCRCVARARAARKRAARTAQQRLDLDDQRRSRNQQRIARWRQLDDARQAAAAAAPPPLPLTLRTHHVTHGTRHDRLAAQAPAQETSS